MGVDLSYYENIKKQIENYPDVLVNLNDCAFLPSVAEDFEELPGFRISLLRYSESEKAFRQARRFLKGESYKEAIKFEYKINLESVNEPHGVNFQFDRDSKLPFRLFAIIGRNGTGKTQYLSNLALDLSGQREDKEFGGEFNPSRPLFSKIIAVSFSIFDQFDTPVKEKTFSYKYCGIRNNKKLLSQKQIDENYNTSINQIRNLNRTDIWYDVLRSIMPENIIREYYNTAISGNDVKTIRDKKRLSSGQSIYLYIFTEIIASIREESLILFDEPEMHLHPQGIAKSLEAFSKILDHFDSYSILATHSPIILQDIPSENVIVFDREGNSPLLYRLPMECFGENLSTITQNVFRTNEVKESYKRIFELYSETDSMDSIENLFQGKLSINARLYLRGCYKD